jgi:hypothetical protein
MVKKLVVSGVALIAVIILIFGYQHFKSLKQKTTDVWQSANPNAVAIIASSDFHQIWEKLNESSLIWQELNLIEEIAYFNQFISQIDSSITRNESLKEFVSRANFLVSIIPSGSGKADIQISTSTPSGLDFEDFLSLFSDSLGKTNTKNYDGADIFAFSLYGKTLYGTISNELLSLSTSSLVIEETVRNINRESNAAQSKSFEKIKQTAGQFAKANVFINYQQLGLLLSNHVSNNYTIWAKSIGKLGHWAALDLDLKSNSIILNGFSNCSDTSNHLLSIFNNQEPQKLSLKEVVPSNTVLLFNIGVSSFTEYLNDYRNWLDSQGALFSYRKNLEKINKRYGVSATALAITWIGKQLGVFYTEMASSKNMAQHKLLIFEANNILNAQRDLNLLSELAGVTENTEVYRGKTIRSLGVGNIYNDILGSAFSGINIPYFTCIDDYVIMANSVSALRDVITKNAVNKTLKNDEAFESFNSQLNSDGNILLYGNLAGANKHLQAIFDKGIADWMTKETERLSNFQSFAFEWTKEQQDLYYQHAIINYNPSYKQETGSLWELELAGAKVTTKPVFVKNHYTNNKEVLVQDDEFNLYLISNVGKQLWKKQLKEVIIGNPLQIDAFKNNKLQYVFVTKNQLHLVDRNGKDVSGFPKTLIARATAPLAVFDYDNNRNYRMIVGCEDGKAYNYDALGEIVTGWKFNQGTSAIAGEIRHFTIGKKDYIMLVEQNGKIHFVDRRGDERYASPTIIENISVFNTYKLVLGKDIERSFVYYTNRAGNLVKQQFNGNKTFLDLELPEGHLFTMDDINNDGSLEVICSKGKNILIITTNGKIILEKEYDDVITGFINTYHFPNNVKRIGFIIPSLKEVHLINVLGENHQGFPLYGETDFSIADINKEQVFSLVTAGSKGKIYTYNLN